MGKQNPITTTFTCAGKEITLETGKLAALAGGSVLVRQGTTMMLATVCAEKEPRPGQDFFPLSVEYREKFAAAGRIPGNFFRREARISDYEVLICRLVDRATRPLFPDNYRCDTQIFITLLSGDKNTPPDTFAALAASAALLISDIPFDGPISEVRVAKINGQFVVNPTEQELEQAELNIIVGGTLQDVTMVEGEAKECTEADMVQAIKVGHEHIKIQCEGQLRLRELLGNPPKRELPPIVEDEELKAYIEQTCKARIYEAAKAGSDKQTRKKAFSDIADNLKAQLVAERGEEWWAANKSTVDKYFAKLHKATIRDVVLTEGRRLDGRRLDEVRPIWCEVDYLPTTHGSALFTRGETQSLTTTTLGSKLDEMMIDNALELYFEKFILHYNFPPFSTGEVKPVRAPGRREIGHGNLAARSLRQVLPPDYPYTVRVVSDILESNGSSSMATVCAGSLSLMDAGVPILAPVSGIAMGLISDNTGRTAILSDILGDEDALGDMDFKVTGTEKGITGCQMDIKIDGMPYELLERALEQARAGRLHILSKMNEVLPAARAELKPHAPRIEMFMIDAEFIGAVIGPGGKMIQGLQKETGCTISVEDIGAYGRISILGPTQEAVEKAMNVIKGIASVPEVGAVYDGKVVRIEEYGAFVEIMPNKQGLLHISEISWERLPTIADAGLNEGDYVQVQLLEQEKNGKLRLSMKSLLPKPEGYRERPPREASDRRDDRRDDRRGGGGGGGFRGRR